MAREWYANRREFSEAEHFVILFTLSLGISTVFATANFAAYLLRPSSYVVDEEVTSELKDRLNSRIQTFEARSHLLREVEKQLKDSKPVSLSYKGSSGWWSGQKFVAAIGSDLRITFKKPPPDNYNPSPRWSARYEFRGQKVDTGVRFSPESKDTTLASLEAEARHWAEVQEIDGVKHTRDFLNRIAPAEPDLRSVPFPLFFYQEVMSVLGANPGYFKPAAFWPRFLAFLAAITKYLYGGLFVSLIVMKRWAQKAES